MIALRDRNSNAILSLRDMVKKSSKRGLNTGNTIRNKHCSFGSAHDYIQVHEESDPRLYQNYADHYNQLLQVIPSAHNDGVGYSLNKKQRWKLPTHVEDLIQSERGNTEHKVNLYIHEEGPKNGVPQEGVGEAYTVKEFRTNLGPVERKTSQRTMHMKTTGQPHSDIDHMSKRQRRKLGRKRVLQMREEEKEKIEAQFENVKSTLNCHVVKQAPENGLMLQTKSFLVNGKPRPSRQRHRVGKAIHIDDFYLNEMGEELDDDDEEEMVAPRSKTASLAEYLDSHLAKSERSSSCSGESMNSDCSFKGNIQYISRQSSRCENLRTNTCTTTHEKSTLHFSPLPNSVRLELNRVDVSYGMLKDKFGEDYEESYCSPRVFNIKLIHHHYLILQQIGDMSDIYRLHVSGWSDFDLSTILPVTSFDELVTITKARLTDETKHSKTVGKSGRPHLRYQTFINSMKNWQITAQQFEEFTQEILKQQIMQTHQNLRNEMQDDCVVIPNKYQRSKSMIIYCGICFDELNPSESTESPFISILPCNHAFCLNCWSAHIQSQLAQASFGIRCPEYDCKTEIDPVLVRSLVEYRLFQRFLERKAELLLQTEENVIYCPNERCNKVIGMKGSLVNKEPVTVYCDCGASACLVCQKDPHWPIPCDLVYQYTDSLRKDGLYNSTADFGKPTAYVVVDFKPCPRCKLPIEKMGGCEHMLCATCGTSFCWICLVPYFNEQYYHNCPKRMVMERKVEFKSPPPPPFGNKHYAQAVRQRCHIGGENEKRSRSAHPNLKKIRLFLSTMAIKHSLTYVEEEGMDNLTGKLRQIATFCYGARRLLENCAALNYIRSGKSTLCPHKLPLLELCLDKIDHLFAQKCSSAILQSIFEAYTHAKQTSDAIVILFSNALYNQ